MNKNNNCRQDRSEGCPGDIPGGRSPDKAGSSLMNKNNNCRQDRSEGCPGDMPGGRSPEKAGSDRMNKNTNCRQDRSEGCPADMPSGIADLQKMAVAEWLQSFNSVRGPMETLGII